MELSPETLKFLSQCFLNTLSPLPDPRRRAEAALAETAARPNYALAVLRLVADPSVDDQIRQSAAVNFKNHLKAHWAPQPIDPAAQFVVIPDPEKEQIKALIVTLMINTSRRIQLQLCEVLTVIGDHEFPGKWPTLLPELVVALGNFSRANDYVSVNGVLATVNSLFKKFRCEFRTEESLIAFKYCLDKFANPLLGVFKRTAGDVGCGVANAGVLKGYIESQRLCCRIFYSFNFVGVPKFFKARMDEWMVEFKNCLTMKYSAVEGSGNDGLALVDELRAAVCENISLYMERDEKIFQKYLHEFVDAVWRLLVDASRYSSRERLTVSAIKVLTMVSTGAHHALFAGDDVLQLICRSIVIPNVKLRDEDEELFEMNYVEFIRRDTEEDSDLDTRRRISCDLLKGIASNYKDKVTEKVSAQVQSLLFSFSQNPTANWKDKDCAIYLVVSLATEKAGDSFISTDLVDVESFFLSVIVPELQSQDVDGFPILKAGALKFFTIFRNQISRPVGLALFPHLIRFLGSKSNVVHSYAASCIEKLLLVKDEGGIERYTGADANSVILDLLRNLFGALEKPESEDNHYVMRCIMRVLRVANVSHEVALPCINALTTVLNRVCENPRSPAFNLYMFQSLSVLIRRACEQDPSIISAFETSLLPCLEKISSSNVSELFPYAFTLLARLVDFNRSPLPGNYMQIFLLLLQSDSWGKYSNFPCIFHVLKAFHRKAPHELNQERLSSVLLMYNQLVSSPSTDHRRVDAAIENLCCDFEKM